MSRYPAIDEVFDLEVDGRVRFFKLVVPRRHPTREALGRDLARRGVPAPVGVRAAFMAAHPNNCHRQPVGFAPAAWTEGMAGGGFPFIDCLGDARLEWIAPDSEFLAYWLWLVEV